MIVWLETSLQLQVTSITEIAKACQISRQSWYNWIKSEIDSKLAFRYAQ